MSTIKYSTHSTLLKDVQLLSNRDRIFCQQNKLITQHQSYSPNIEGFKEAIQNREKNQPDRKLLVSVLKTQYESIFDNSELHKFNNLINQLSDKSTFTVTTAHQPVLFGGPLYTLYKIAGTINLSNKLNEAFPNKKIIPVFVIGSEDHDFDEMKSISLYNKNISWVNNETGSVGRMSNKGVMLAIKELKELLRDTPNDKEIIKILESCFVPSLKYAFSYQKFILQLFKNYDLIVLNMDDKKLKKSFSSIMNEELIHQSSKQYVIDTQKIISNDGMNIQVYPRDINLFYNHSNKRLRITKEGDSYIVLDSTKCFSKSEILTELKNHPERFSPNVILRPVYQEFTLPNLSYVGGGGEIAYWLEINKVFELHNIPFPILLRRNSALWINKKDDLQMTKAGWMIDQLFNSKEDIKKQYLTSQNATMQTIEEEKTIEAIFTSLQNFALKENLDLHNFLIGQQTKANKIVLHASKKINQGLKLKHDVQLVRIDKIHNKLFPNQKLQERKNNFIPIYSIWGTEFIDVLISNLNPLNFSFVVFIEK